MGSGFCSRTSEDGAFEGSERVNSPPALHGPLAGGAPWCHKAFSGLMVRCPIRLSRLPDREYRRLRRVAEAGGATVGQFLREVASATAVSDEPEAAPLIKGMSDAEVLKIAGSKMGGEARRRLSELLESQQGRKLSAEEQHELSRLLQRSELGELRKSRALREAVRRGRNGWSFGSNLRHSIRLSARQRAMDVSSDHWPGSRVNGPPPVMSLTGSNVPGGWNSTAVPPASPAPRPRRQPRYRSAAELRDVIFVEHARVFPLHRCQDVECDLDGLSGFGL